MVASVLLAVQVGAAVKILNEDEPVQPPKVSTLELTEFSPLQVWPVVTNHDAMDPPKHGNRPSPRLVRSTQKVRHLERGVGGSLASIRNCESGGNYDAISASGKYRGAYQFDARTHRSVGGDGDASDDSPAEQDAAAARLMAKRGRSPWPNC